MRRLIDEAWDRINPPIEEGDLEPRAAAFNWLGDPDRGAFFPNSLRHVPIVRLGNDAFGWQYWRDVQDGKGTATKDALEKAIAAAGREECQTSVDDLAAALKELDGIGTTLDGKMADAAPSLGEIRKALEDCQTLAQEILNRKGPAPRAAADEDETDNEDQKSGGDRRGGYGRAGSREEIFAQLGELSAQLIQMEPQSPVAYIIQRAVKLGQLPFPQLLKVLIRNQEVLNELNRDLDLGYEPPTE